MARMREKVSLVIEFNNVLTRRLLRRRPDLLNPARLDASVRGAASLRAGGVDQMNFHRTYLETGALAMAVHSLAGWQCFDAILHSFNGFACHPAMQHAQPRACTRLVRSSLPAPTRLRNATPSWSAPKTDRAVSRVRGRALCHRVHLCALRVTELLTHEELASSTWSFTALSHRVTTAGHGILIGWRRTDSHSSSTSLWTSPKALQARVVLNPRHKDALLRWCNADVLVVLKRDMRARRRHLTIARAATTKNLFDVARASRS